MGKIIGINNQAEEDDIKLKASQWILILEMDLANDVVAVTQDYGTLPPKNGHQKKVSEDNNFTTLCNALAQVVGHLVTNGVPLERCLNKIQEALLNNIMPAEEAWKIKGGIWKLFLVYQPTTGLMSIRRSVSTDESILPGEEKDAVNKDFYLICKGLHTFIQHLISIQVPVEKLNQTILDVIVNYLAVGRLSGEEGRLRIQMEATRPKEEVEHEELINEAIQFLQKLLPEHYKVSALPRVGVRCISSIGIDSKSEWKSIEDAISKNFNKQFVKILHQLKSKNLDFTVFLKLSPVHKAG